MECVVYVCVYVWCLWSACISSMWYVVCVFACVCGICGVCIHGVCGIYMCGVCLCEACTMCVWWMSTCVYCLQYMKHVVSMCCVYLCCVCVSVCVYMCILYEILYICVVCMYLYGVCGMYVCDVCGACLHVFAYVYVELCVYV